MTPEQFKNERDFCAIITLASAMLAQGVIDETDFFALQRKLLEQFSPAISCLPKGGALCN